MVSPGTLKKCRQAGKLLFLGVLSRGRGALRARVRTDVILPGALSGTPVPFARKGLAWLSAWFSAVWVECLGGVKNNVFLRGKGRQAPPHGTPTAVRVVFPLTKLLEQARKKVLRDVAQPGSAPASGAGGR